MTTDEQPVLRAARDHACSILAELQGSDVRISGSRAARLAAAAQRAAAEEPASRIEEFEYCVACVQPVGASAVRCDACLAPFCGGCSARATRARCPHCVAEDREALCALEADEALISSLGH
jgi:hypothetical protein